MLGRHLLYQSGPPIPVGEKWTFTSNGSWVAPANGNYKITLVGAGGKGGSGCIRITRKRSYDGESWCEICDRCGSASGGGGGAGQTVIQTYVLKKDTSLTITIGQPNSNPSKISGAVSLTANGGNTGGSAYTYSMGGYCQDKAVAGGVAANYGTGGGSGYISDRYNHSPTGGAGKVSDYGNGYGQGGSGGRGEWNNGSYHTGYNGTAGICVIEYLGRR